MSDYINYNLISNYTSVQEDIRNWVPSVQVESANGKHVIDLKTMLLTNRKIFLTGEVDTKMASDFIQQVMYLTQTDGPIDIYIDSPGGVVNSGLIIYDTIQSLEGIVEINMYCTGMAASMAALIFAGGQKGRRFILPHSQVMVHDPLLSAGPGGSATAIKKTADSIMKTRKLTNTILSKHTGKSLKEINKATSFDNYMTAEEALRFGICDEIKNLY